MSRNNSTNSRLVYSDEMNNQCSACGKALHKCRCSDACTMPQGPIKVERQTKGRKGKGVSLITGLPLGDTEKKVLAKELKQRCGCGGTVKDGVIEIQTDQRDLLIEVLRSKGYEAKKAGG